MKKILILISCIFLTGCTTALSTTLSLDTAVSTITNETINESNTVGLGFKYYKPRDFTLLDYKDYNHTLINKSYKYYLNVDINSYLGKKSNNYVVDNSLYYSNKFTYNNKNGFLEIRNGFNSYFYIKMMYNYSYIEVSVLEKDIKEAVINSAIILTSIKYNDKVIEKLINSGDLNDKETTFELEKPKVENNNNILDVYGKTTE